MRNPRSLTWGWSTAGQQISVTIPWPIVAQTRLAPGRPSAVMIRSFAPDVHDWIACAGGSGAGPPAIGNPLRTNADQASLERSAVPEGAEGRVDLGGQGSDRGQHRGQWRGADAL